MDEDKALPAAVAADLAEVGAALDLPAEAVVELGDGLRACYRDAALTVPSLVGLSLVYRLPTGDAVLSTLQPDVTAGQVAASLQLPVGPTTPGTAAAGGRCVLVLYADQSGAFTDLAAGLADLLDDDARSLLLVDQHLEVRASDLSAFRHAALHDVAAGVLLGRGFTEIGASTFLEALTAASEGDPDAAARQVIRSVR